MSLRDAFSRFLDADPDRLHVAAHSHHPWPDVTAAAQRAAWEAAASGMDDKWDVVFGEVIPEFQRHVAGRLSLPDPATVAVGPNTHGFVLRILSCLPRPTRILTTDGEFHSFSRQTARMAEAGEVDLEVVPVEPFDTFPDRFAAAASAGGHHLVFLSHVFFNSGYVVPDLRAVVDAVPEDATFVVIDGYHGFMALPTDLAALADRCFYLAGGYKYAMAGEGCCFLHCPPGYGERPVDTGWYAAFGALADADASRVPYAEGGARFLGATFDPTPLYRFNAVQRWFDRAGLTVTEVHRHVGELQARLLEALDERVLPISSAGLLPGTHAPDRGHFLTFRTDLAGELYDRMHARGVITDRRADRWRIGFGIYHDPSDVDELVARLDDELA